MDGPWAKIRDDSYQIAILVRGGDTIKRLAENPEKYYLVINQTKFQGLAAPGEGRAACQLATSLP